MMNGWDMNVWGWTFMTIMMVVGVLILIAIIQVITRGSAASDQSNNQETPFDVLRRRYASGEIDEPEFKQRMDGLNKSH